MGWIVHDYRGIKIVQHGGAVDGMLGLVGMVPAERLGIVILTNRLPHRLTWALQFKIFDTFIGGAGKDWSAVMKAESDEEAEKARRAAQAAEASSSARPALPLDRYAGTYASDLSGKVAVTLEGGALVFSRPMAAASLEHDRNNRFLARWRSDGLLSVFGKTPVGFTIGPAGEVTSLELGPDRFRREAEAERAQPSRPFAPQRFSDPTSTSRATRRSDG